MSEPFVFDPRCELCKTPFGAAACGELLTFCCRPLASEDFTHCSLVLHQELSSLWRELELSPAGFEGERAVFRISLPAPEKPDLVWYYFRFWREDKSGCDLDKTGYRSDGLQSPWQLTVYRKSQTPDWFQRGAVYQIFPDRFCRLPEDTADVSGLVGNRWVHEDWTDTPAWRPDGDGEIRNRDFFGGTLRGIASRLPLLAEMGVGTLYLCPIFESASNHRYNTADYTKIDPLLGREEDLRALCAKAKELGIHVMLDGVFNHIGSQSLYFNNDGFYPTLGAAQSQDSPYFNWFSFHPWPDDYDSWWGIKTLPAVREECPSYVDYIIENENSIIRRWLRAGADGWRLDVADELPDWFIEKIRTAVEETKPNAFLLGEVWEDASNKVSYSQRRKYLLGGELHSVMNYPFRTALLDYLRGGDADRFREAMETLRENYPHDAFYSALNFLGTHDTARILTVLGADHVPESKDARASFRLSPPERQKGEALVRLAALVLFTFPGAPMVYYGDELGLEGWEDPFNRGTYPEEAENSPLRNWFTRLGKLRRQKAVLQSGIIRWVYTSGPLLAFARESAEEVCLTAVNTGAGPRTLTVNWPFPACTDLLSGKVFYPENGRVTVEVPPSGGLLLAP